MTNRIVIDLPWPPSQNRIWRSGRGRVYRSQNYAVWAREAGWIIKAAKLHPIKGWFKAKITIYPPNKREIDLDNRVKVLLDLAQAAGLIENDKKCRLLVVSYGPVKPMGGARLFLKPM